MEALSFEWLLAIGILLIALEVLTFSFFLFPIGVGFMIVAMFEFLDLGYESFFPQLATVLIIAFALILFLRKKFIYMIGQSSTIKESQVHKSGVGIIEKGQIKFSGTYWNTDDDLSSYGDGDRVNVKIIKNRAIISKIS
jgi:membrane protein implicated in regulation of membrane protease activity